MGYASIIEKRRKERLEDLRKKYMEELKKVKNIADKFYLKRIYLFGSLVEKDKFHFNSDIDLVVEGMKEKDFLKFYAAILKEVSFPVDLKKYEDLPEGGKKALKKGKVIYEKK